MSLSLSHVLHQTLQTSFQEQKKYLKKTCYTAKSVTDPNHLPASSTLSDQKFPSFGLGLAVISARSKKAKQHGVVSELGTA